MSAATEPGLEASDQAAAAATPSGSGREPDSTATPPSWRIAAIGLLVGGAAAGWALGRGRQGRLIGAASLAIAATAVPVALAGRRPPVPPARARQALADAASPPTFSIVVAARDEAAVLPLLIEDIAAQDYRDAAGQPLFELIVVDDRSTDGSAEAVLASAERCGIAGVTRLILRRGDDLPEGKGAALTAAQPEICHGEVVLVLDGDARIDPSFLRHAAGYFAAGMSAATARRRIAAASSSHLAGAQADEQTLDGELQRGRWSMGGCSEFRGNGIMLRRDLLERVGGWRARALTEDLDLSSRVAASDGVNVAWAIDAEVWEEPVRDPRGLWRQRLRWAEGSLRRLLEYTPAVLRSRHLKPAAKLDYLIYAGQLAVPPLGIGLAAGALSRGRFRLVAVVAGGYLTTSGILGFDSLRWERDIHGAPIGLRERAVRTVRVTLFNALWLAVIPRALLALAVRRGRVRYVKMQHSGFERKI